MANYREILDRSFLDKLNENYLLDLLNQYSTILNKDTISYLNDLLKLKYSVATNSYTKNNEILNHLDIYRYIAQYNIYHKTKEELEKRNILFNDDISFNENEYKILRGYLEDGVLLDITLNKDDMIAAINLYNTDLDRKRQILELNYLKEQLASMKNKKDIRLPNMSSCITDNGEEKIIYSIPYGLDKNRIIQKQLENDILILNEQINLKLNQDEKEQLEIHNYQYSSLLNFYSLCENKMKEITTNSRFEKTLVYNKNGLKFISSTSYIK